MTISVSIHVSLSVSMDMSDHPHAHRLVSVLSLSQDTPMSHQAHACAHPWIGNSGFHRLDPCSKHQPHPQGTAPAESPPHNPSIPGVWEPFLKPLEQDQEQLWDLLG